jgi:hypothetical protein
MIKILLQAHPQNLKNLKRNSIYQLHVLEQITIKSRRKMLVKPNQHYCQQVVAEIELRFPSNKHQQTF